MAGSSSDAPLSLVDAMEDAASTTKVPKSSGKKRLLKKSDTDEVVEKVLRESLKDLTPVQKYVLKSQESLTCEETLRRDKKARRRGDQQMIFGRTYYDNIRSSFADPGAAQVHAAHRE